jgi:type IV secretory pathway TrbD component
MKWIVAVLGIMLAFLAFPRAEAQYMSGPNISQTIMNVSDRIAEFFYSIRYALNRILPDLGLQKIVKGFTSDPMGIVFRSTILGLVAIVVLFVVSLFIPLIGPVIYILCLPIVGGVFALVFLAGLLYLSHQKGNTWW